MFHQKSTATPPIPMQRKHHQNILKSKGVIFEMFAFTELEQIQSKSSLKFQLNSKLEMPVVIKQKFEDFVEISSMELYGFSSKRIISSLIFNFKMNYSTEFQLDDQCSDKNIENIYVFSSKWPNRQSTLMFRGCRVHMEEDEVMQVNEVYVVLTETTSIDKIHISKYLMEKRLFNYLKYKEFDDQVVCGCSDLEFYISECHTGFEENRENINVGSFFVMFGVFLIVSMVVNAIRIYMEKA
jgi:hypothetical protein